LGFADEVESRFRAQAIVDETDVGHVDAEEINSRLERACPLQAESTISGSAQEIAGEDELVLFVVDEQHPRELVDPLLFRWRHDIDGRHRGHEKRGWPGVVDER
jgi:hypothetical protein